MIEIEGGYTYRTADELNLQYYIDLAKKQVGTMHDVLFQTRSKLGQKAGTFTILDFKEKNPGWKYDYFYHEKGLDVITGAHLGIFKIQFHDTKFYNEKIMSFETSAYVQDHNGNINDHLWINTVDVNSGKEMKAYRFQILNWD